METIVSDLVLSGKVCPYCSKNTIYVDSVIIYRKSYGMVYYCIPCKAWVGVHKGTDVALGRLANAELRKWKIKAHDLFDKLWKKKATQGYSRKVARETAYIWLSGQMGTTRNRTHIGMYDLDQCKKVVELCQKYFK